MSETCPYCRGTGRIEATLAVRLTALRQAKGINQEDVAHAAGVSRSQIANLERGRGEPSIQSLIKLASYWLSDFQGWNSPERTRSQIVLKG
jgi:transcriptional regulator with XRE-family HTH domain